MDQREWEGEWAKEIEHEWKRVKEMHRNSFSQTMAQRRRNRLNLNQSHSKQNEHFGALDTLNMYTHLPPKQQRNGNNLIPRIMSLKNSFDPYFFWRLSTQPIHIFSINRYLHIILFSSARWMTQWDIHRKVL